MFDAPNLTGFARTGRCRLPAAFAASLAIHGLTLVGALFLDGPDIVAAVSPPLHATLVPAPPPLPAAPVLLAPEPPAVARPESSPHPPPLPSQPRTEGRSFELGDAAAQALRQVARHVLYPPDAIAAGLEGEALVTLFLDGQGNAVAARLERTSGHAVLDEAAVRAARTVRALPDGAPSEVLLPVRFSLRR